MVAVAKGNSVRGARYNSAVTYVDNRKEEGDRVMAVIISADESTDIYIGK